MRKKRKKKRILKRTILFIFLDIFAIAGFVMMYGPWDYVRDLYVTTAMQTMTHKWLAKVFYSDKRIFSFHDLFYDSFVEYSAIPGFF